MWVFPFYLQLFVIIILLTIYWTSWVFAQQLTYIISFYPPSTPCFINKNAETLRGKKTWSCPKSFKLQPWFKPMSFLLQTPTSFLKKKLIYFKPQFLNYLVTSNIEKRLRVRTLRPYCLGSNIVLPFKNLFISLCSALSSMKQENNSICLIRL